MILALDTATRQLSLAVHDGHCLRAEQTWQMPKQHTARLAPAIHDLLGFAEARVADLTAIAVVNGPGSYTGVRVGVSMAKGLAAAQNLPLIGINTLDVLAAAQPPNPNGAILIVAVQAGRGRVIAGRYRWNYVRWVQRGDPQLLKWAELYERIDSRVIIAGDVDDAARDAHTVASQANPDLNVSFASGAYSLRRAGFAAELGWERLREGSANDFPADQLMPLYLNTLD